VQVIGQKGRRALVTRSPVRERCGMTHRQPDRRKYLLLDVLVGGLIGTLVGAIVSVNIVIYSGVERGYQATPPEVFSYSPLVGVLAVLALIAGPVAGVLVARRRRRNRAH